jgi:hypothetical protein
VHPRKTFAGRGCSYGIGFRGLSGAVLSGRVSIRLSGRLTEAASSDRLRAAPLAPENCSSPATAVPELLYPEATEAKGLFPKKKQNRRFNKTMLIRKCRSHALRVGIAGAGLKKETP